MRAVRLVWPMRVTSTAVIRVDLLDFLEPTSQLWVQGKNEARATMNKTILFLLLAWIAIYAGNHLLFKSVPKNSEVATALRSQPDSERREIDSWGPYLPGGRADQKPNVASMNALPIQEADATGRGDQRLAENLPSLQPSEADRLPASIPPPVRKPSSAPDRGSNLRTEATRMAAEQNGKIVAQQKRGLARATNLRNSARRFGQNTPEEAWLPSPPPHAPRFAENRPEKTFPSPSPRRWHSGMFMFAPPDF
jgi:hypothetical protein